MTETKIIVRPLSPHLQIYRITLTMLLSVAHRMSGMVLYFGLIFLIGYFLALSNGPASFAIAQSFFSSIFGLLVLFGYSFVAIHHLLGGVRHLVEDLGYGFAPEVRELLARGHVYASVGLTIVFWFVALIVTS